MASAILAARILGKIVYGELGIIQSTVGMFGTLAGFGMGTTASKFVAEFRAKDPVKAGRIIALSSLVSWITSSALAVVLVCLAPWLSERTLAAPHLASSVELSALLLLLSGINGALIGVLLGFEAFKSIARISFLAGVLAFPLTVVGALFFGLSGIIWGMILALAGECLLRHRAVSREALRHNIAVSYSSCLTELPTLWQFSIPAVLGILVMNVVNWAAAAMFVRQPNGYGEMGAFNAANQWFNALMWLPHMLGSVVLPLLAERHAADDRQNSVKLLRMSVAMNVVTALPLVLLGCLVSPYIMMSYGEGFADAWPTLVAVLITAGLIGLELPVGQLFAASGRMWLGVCLNTGWGLVFLGATWLLLNWGSFGLASARLLAYLVHAVWVFAYVGATVNRIGTP
jgi:O-antigen/teichoic acid export membrane protein